MKSQPLTSNDHAKLLVFSIIILPAVLFFGAGLIPTVFLGLGVFMMKKHKCFSYIETAVKYFNYYNYVFITVLLIASFYWFIEEFNTYTGYYYFFWLVFSALIPAAYIVVAQFFLQAIKKSQ